MSFTETWVGRRHLIMREASITDVRVVLLSLHGVIDHFATCTTNFRALISGRHGSKA